MYFSPSNPKPWLRAWSSYRLEKFLSEDLLNAMAQSIVIRIFNYVVSNQYLFKYPANKLIV